MNGIFPRVGKKSGRFSKGWKKTAGFTLVELLVVMAVIAVLAAWLTPALVAGLDRAQSGKCQSNLRQLFVANTLYAADHGSYVAAAPDMFEENLIRWHGVRTSTRSAFNGSKGALYEYLAKNDGIRACPAFKDFRSGKAYNAFEDSCGGYGYNDRGVGSRAYCVGYNSNGMSRGMAPASIQEPASTVMFCDTAYPQPYSDPKYLIEYSLAEAYRFVDSKEPVESDPANPTIHFRHHGKANVVWCDGHISAESMTVTGSEQFARFNLGWFGAADNKLFDPF